MTPPRVLLQNVSCFLDFTANNSDNDFGQDNDQVLTLFLPFLTSLFLSQHLLKIVHDRGINIAKRFSGGPKIYLLDIKVGTAASDYYISRYNNRENVLVSKLYILLILDKLIGDFHTN